MIGEKFGKWEVVDGPFATTVKRGYAYLVRCACGYEGKRYPYQIRRTTECRACAAITIGKVNRLSDWDATVSQTYHSYCSGARSRGHSFELTKEQFEAMMKMDCDYCGSPPTNRWGKSGSLTRTNGSFVGLSLYQGVDRKDNTIGYTLENSVPCCKICNRAKNNLDYDEWLTYLSNIASKWRE